MNDTQDAAVPNRMKLMVASFMTLIAAGVGFGVRGGLLAEWGSQYGFTNTELGIITGQGLVGFGIVIILASLITDKLGYKTILLGAFGLHVISAVITLLATPANEIAGKEGAYWCLLIGMFTFSVANGLCEAVINPLVATIFPKEKTHYLNILHAGWPGGLILGGFLGLCVVGENALIAHLSWEVSWGLFLVPTLIYGFMILKEKFPASEAAEAGVSFGEMILTTLSPLLLFLFFLQACVGYVELGTDSWIASITEKITDGQGFQLFIYASAIMFVLRFFAGPIVEKINPIGLLLMSAVIGCVGLLLVSYSSSMAMAWIAVGIYGVGKTFLWPTMLGVVGERFPKGGAVTMGMMGGIGMLSAGLLGGPGIGYKQDYYASNDLKEKAEVTYNRYSADKENGFLFFPKITGLDGQKVGVLTEKQPGSSLEGDLKKLEAAEAEGKKSRGAEDLKALGAWWDDAKSHAESDKPLVEKAQTFGGRMALRWTAAVPATMAIGYLLLLFYFMSKGGYQQEVLHGEKPDGEHYTGGVEGPMEA